MADLPVSVKWRVRRPTSEIRLRSEERLRSLGIRIDGFRRIVEAFDPEGLRALLPVGEQYSLGEIWSLSGFPWQGEDGSN